MPQNLYGFARFFLSGMRIALQMLEIRFWVPALHRKRNRQVAGMQIVVGAGAAHQDHGHVAIANQLRAFENTVACAIAIQHQSRVRLGNGIGVLQIAT